MTSNKLKVAILGTGNIGTDLLMKIHRSPVLECRIFAGRNLASPGMTKASLLGVAVTAKGVESILELKNEIALVFDATSAEDHFKHAPLFEKAGIVAVDLTPAKVGQMCVPAVNLDACLNLPNVNMITCGGQASIPLAYAIAQANKQVEYIETVSSIASRSAGPATRINLDEYLYTTETGLALFSSCKHTKAIINLNPAQPCVHMQTTVMAKITNPDLAKTREKIAEVVTLIKQYVPGYQLILEPIIENGRLITMVRVDGLGDYLPKYAGNLDIINCAAVAFAEAYARRRNA
ncbi:MAG: acetaldehyde dehydrogenase (acetylating) [Opitutus sp.]|nr:acetaldehyde dehydrogenase (acetylating) [Opitutus sp.]MCS6277750.1 acetaldehyde dehydrogenase (acetylating) [Opitutus sp.]MCS6299144.1 acetaldehyde dehydrogenase (acetylating) [Opitutus sp.]